MAAEEQKNLCRGSEESAWSQGKTTTITSLLLVCFWELKNLVRVRRPSRTHYDVFIMTGLNLLQLRSNTHKKILLTYSRSRGHPPSLSSGRPKSSKLLYFIQPIQPVMTDSTPPPSKRSKKNDKEAKEEEASDAMSVDDDDPANTPPATYQLLPGYGEHKRAVSSVKFAPTRLTKRSALCASSSADGVIKLWDLQDGLAATETNLLEPKLSCTGHSRGINEICWNPVSPLLASASDDKTVRLWDAVTGDTLVEYRGHDNFVFCVDQHEHMVVSGSFDETVKIWDVRGFVVLYNLCLLEGSACLVCTGVLYGTQTNQLTCLFSPLPCPSSTNSFLLQIRSGDCVSTLPAHSDPVTSVSFSRDGTVVCSASHDGLIRLWDVPTGECLKTIYAAGNPPVCMAKFSPNSKYILAGTLMDATLRLWPVHRTGSNQCARSYSNQKHHTNSKYSIAADFTYDGNIITGSETGDLVLYDLQTTETLQVLKKHEDAVLAVSAHDRYPLLASGSMTDDRRVYFWAPEGYTLPQEAGATATAPAANDPPKPSD